MQLMEDLHEVQRFSREIAYISDWRTLADFHFSPLVLKGKASCENNNNKRNDVAMTVLLDVQVTNCA